jgi:hypothetical protein
LYLSYPLSPYLSLCLSLSLSLYLYIYEFHQFVIILLFHLTYA